MFVEEFIRFIIYLSSGDSNYIGVVFIITHYW